MSFECLVYVDPSPRGQWALDMAALLPAAWRAGLCLLATEDDMQADPQLLSRARQQLGAGPPPREAIRRGPAERAVAEEAASRRYGLLIVPPAGRNAVQRMLKGSRVATVVRSVPAPVLVARRPPPRVERVLAAVSGGRLTEAVCAAAARMGAALGAEVAFLHVAAEVALPYAPSDERAAGKAPARDEPDPLAVVRAALRRQGREAALVTREGLVVDEVLDEFDRGAHHLLVVGASPETERGRFGREDLTERLLLKCPASTLVVPPSGLAAP